MLGRLFPAVLPASDSQGLQLALPVRGIELTELERGITIYDLLTQTSGLVSDGWLSPPLAKLVAEIGLKRSENTLQEFTQRLVKLPLIHQPGMAWRYGESPEVLGYLT